MDNITLKDLVKKNKFQHDFLSGFAEKVAIFST